MLVILSLGGGPVSLKQIREAAAEAGWRIPLAENISMPMLRTNGAIIKTPRGWELTKTGRGALESLGLVLAASNASVIVHDLSSNLEAISNHEAKLFIQEAVQCFESGFLRPAVLMSWIGAVYLLYDYVVKNKLNEFNAECLRINAKFKSVSNVDQIAKALGEAEFLDRLENIAVITNSIKKDLIECLNRRNSCGHPNSYRPTKNNVVHHLEVLLLNVYQRYS